MQRTSSLRILTLLLLATPTVAQSLPTIPPSLDATAATGDPVLLEGSSNHAVFLTGVSTDLIFEPAARFTQDRQAGTAQLKGRAVDANDPTKVLDVDITFTGLTAVAGAGSPKLGLKQSAYVGNGGPIDPASWYYYTSLSGTLTGMGSWAGGQLDVTPRGAAPQVGVGANNKNGLYGLGTWFDPVIVQQPTQGPPWTTGIGDLNINLHGDCLCATASLPDPSYTTASESGAFTIANAFGCDTDWDLINEAVLDVDATAGMARITGEMVAQNDPTCRFCFDITLQGLVVPGDPTYPPSGSPFVGNILPAGLFSNGGATDPKQWMYYTTMTGTLLGKDSLAGAQISVAENPDGHAAQLGTGTARNRQHGLYAPLRLTVVQQPTIGLSLTSADAVGWFELGQCPRPTFMPLGASPVPSLPTVTNGCYLLQGCSLDTIEQVQFGPHVIQSQDPCDFGRGYFEIVNANTLRFCPPLCLTPGDFSFTASDGSGATSAPLPLEITEPSGPVLACPPQLRPGCKQSLWIWGGPQGPLRFCVFISPSTQPSIIPGFVSLDIGNSFTSIMGWDGIQPNCYEHAVGPVTTAILGATLYFQAFAVDPNNVVLPITQKTNVCSTTYIP